MDIRQLSAANAGPGGPVALSAVRREAAPAPAAPAAVKPAAQSAPVETAKSAAISDAEVKHSLEAINRFLQPVSGDIQFSQDEETGRMIVKIVDTKSNTVLRQIPSVEAVAIAKQLDKLQGLLVRDKV